MLNVMSFMLLLFVQAICVRYIYVSRNNITKEKNEYINYVWPTRPLYSILKKLHVNNYSPWSLSRNAWILVVDHLLLLDHGGWGARQDSAAIGVVYAGARGVGEWLPLMLSAKGHFTFFIWSKWFQCFIVQSGRIILSWAIHEFKAPLRRVLEIGDRGTRPSQGITWVVELNFLSDFSLLWSSSQGHFLVRVAERLVRVILSAGRCNEWPGQLSNPLREPGRVHWGLNWSPCLLSLVGSWRRVWVWLKIRSVSERHLSFRFAKDRKWVVGARPNLCFKLLLSQEPHGSLHQTDRWPGEGRIVCILDIVLPWPRVV